MAGDSSQENNPQTFEVGDRVEARFEGGANYFPGGITGKNSAGLDILYDDGDRETGVVPDLVRKLNEDKPGNAASKGIGDFKSAAACVSQEKDRLRVSARDGLRQAADTCGGEVKASMATESNQSVTIFHQQPEDPCDDKQEEGGYPILPKKDQSEVLVVQDRLLSRKEGFKNASEQSMQQKIKRRSRRCPKVRLEEESSKSSEGERNTRGRSEWPLERLVLRGHAGEVATRLRRDGSALQRDAHGWTALHWASSRGDPDVVGAVLCALRAIPAVIGCHLDVVYLLMNEGCDPSVKDNVGDRPVDCLKPLRGNTQAKLSSIHNALLDLSDTESGEGEA